MGRGTEPGGCRGWKAGRREAGRGPRGQTKCRVFGKIRPRRKTKDDEENRSLVQRRKAGREELEGPGAGQGTAQGTEPQALGREGAGLQGREQLAPEGRRAGCCCPARCTCRPPPRGLKVTGQGEPQPACSSFGGTHEEVYWDLSAMEPCAHGKQPFAIVCLLPPSSKTYFSAL